MESFASISHVTSDSYIEVLKSSWKISEPHANRRWTKSPRVQCDGPITKTIANARSNAAGVACQRWTDAALTAA